MSKTAFAAPALKPAAAGFVNAASTRTTSTDKPVRITVDLPRDLHRRVKIEALNQGKAMTDLIREWIELNCKP